MMATTEIEKVPPTIQSRSQVFELKTIGVKQIADQLRTIAAAEQIDIDDTALMLIARAGDGSMRDAQSAFDQVIAFAGTSISAEDVSTVLGLVRRELLLEMAAAVAREDGAAAFRLVDRAIEAGYDPRVVVRELSRLARDLLVIKIDPARLEDPEIAAEGERAELTAAAKEFSTEDLMRAFEVLAKGEVDIRASMQPRFHLEMTLLRWIHLRKLVPLSDLIAGLEKGSGGSTRGTPGSRPSPTTVSRPASPAAVPRPSTAAPVPVRSNGGDTPGGNTKTETAPRAPASRQVETAASLPQVEPVPVERLKDAFLDEIRKVKKFFHGTVIAQAQKITLEDDRIVITFGSQHRALRSQLDQSRPLLESIATQLAGRKMTVVSAEGAISAPAVGGADKAARPDATEKQAALREQALADSGVQAMLDVFSAEIRDVEEM
jgi:DNA polymerase-3 subunit gamma/tau